MAKAKNMMAVDLERLLNHKEEMSVMKQVVLSMNHPDNKHVVSSKGKERPTRGPTPRSPKSGKGAGLKQRAGGLPGHHTKSCVFEAAERDENVHRPPPTQFVSRTEHASAYYQSANNILH